MNSRFGMEEKNTDPDETEKIVSRCCRPKGIPDPNKKYSPIEFYSGPPKYDPKNNMYFFSVPDQNPSDSELINKEHNEHWSRICIIL